MAIIKHMKNTFIVPFDTYKIYFGLSVVLCMTIALMALFIFIPTATYLFGPELVILLRIILVLLIAMLSFGLAYGFFWDLRKPAATLSSEGISIQRFGLIPWHAIDDFNVYAVPGTPIEALGIRLKNPSRIALQSTFEGKCVLFWARIFGQHYQISLSCLALPEDEIISFARQFMPSKN